MEFDVDRNIVAGAQRIWRILTNAAGYADWDNGISSIEGEIVAGGKITVRSGGGSQKHKVVELVPNERMTWKSSRPRVVRTFALTERPNGTTDVRIHGVVSGFGKKQLPDLRITINDFVDGLKKQAESTI